jgi:DNA-directed RNA polymerase subunit beta
MYKTNNTAKEDAKLNFKNFSFLKATFAKAKASLLGSVQKQSNRVIKQKAYLKPEKKIQVLEKYHRSNQDTSLIHKPAVKVGEWLESGDLLADNSASMNGELAIGKNIVVAYMPWEGFNYEDAILINERLVYDDVYTSVHIERYEIETKTSQFGGEQVTREIPDLNPEAIAHLDKYGIAKIGSWLEEGDILVGKVTPINKKSQTPYQRLLFQLLDKTVNTVRDSSLRAPKGIKANVINVQIMEANIIEQRTKAKGLKKKTPVLASITPNHLLKQEASKGLASKKKLKNVTSKASFATTSLKKSPFKSFKTEYISKKTDSFVKARLKPNYLQTENITNNSYRSCLGFVADSQKNNKTISIGSLLGLKASVPVKEALVPSIFSEFALAKVNKKKPKKQAARLASQEGLSFTLLDKTISKSNVKKKKDIRFKNDIKPMRIPTNIHLYLAEKRKIQVGDKMAGRHGNKGIISNILPRQDMPYLPDGTAVDIVLNPLGVPSRMNVGQIYECLLGLAGKYLGEHYKIAPFDEIYGAEASRSFVFFKLFEASKKTGIEWLFDPNTPGKIRLLDGRTGECFDQPITVGIAYMLKLVHMVDDKIHMRSTGPYSLVTQQPLRGRAKQGGQRLGEMEVWAIEGYGAAFVLLEMLTLKSDDMTGRLTLWSNLILDKEITIGTPESFKVLVCELQALCLDIGLFNLTSINTGRIQKDPTQRISKTFVLKEISHLMLLP